MSSERGQSLIEVIVAATVGILVVTALTFATIFSIRNASFAKNSAQATKLAQEGLENVRSIRDRDSIVDFNANRINFSGLFALDLSHNSCSDKPCYFRFVSGILSQGTDVNFEPVGSFKRQVAIGDQVSPVDTTGSEKTVTVIVQWKDFAGDHESKLTTILRKL